MNLTSGIGIIYNPRAPRFKEVVDKLVGTLGSRVSSWIVPTSGVNEASPPESISLIITVGGDGTILWAARIAAPLGIPLLGVNLGRVGFMSELDPEGISRIGKYLEDDIRVEERSMLQATVISQKSPDITELIHHALNDVVVGHGSISRLAHLEICIDGATFTTYRADAVILATATGSTGYSISAGGPILHPQSNNMLLNPVANHLGLSSCLVLPPDSVVDVTIRSDYDAAFSLDGRADISMETGDTLRIVRSPHVAKFLRADPPSYFFSVLTSRLNPDARHNA